MVDSDVGFRPGVEAQPTKRFRILSLTGGGYRGLFTVQVLDRIEKAIGKPIREHFDLIAGTSIGGIVAIGLAQGMNPATISSAFEKHGKAIFPKPRLFGRWGLTQSRYDANGLAKTIDAVLGETKGKPLSQVKTPLIVTAVDFGAWAPAIFETTGMSPGLEETSLRDIALATSAAPTYFPDHVIDGHSYVDGGLIANAPDTIALMRAIGRYGRMPQDIDLISIGTAGELRWDIPRKPRRRGGLMLIAKDEMVSRTMKAQEALSLDLVESVLGLSYVRIDKVPSPEQQKQLALDRATDMATQILCQLAREAYADATGKPGGALKAMLR
jgi:patatin-like phospholipase/acyl hydrolase